MPTKPFLLLALALAPAACRIGLDDRVEADHVTKTLAQNGRCSVLETRQFASLDQRECGIAPGAIALCAWAVQFTSRDAGTSNFAWRYSDVGESGDVTCVGDLVHVTTGGRTFDATYDPVTQQLTWDNVTYAAP